MSDFLMPALGADMEAGTLVEWLVKPGDRVKKGDVVAVVETQKGAIEVEIFDEGIVSELVVPVGTKVPVGGVLAHIADGKPTEPPRAAPSTTPAEPRRTAPDIAKPPEPVRYYRLWQAPKSPRRRDGARPNSALTPVASPVPGSTAR